GRLSRRSPRLEQEGTTDEHGSESDPCSSVFICGFLDAALGERPLDGGYAGARAELLALERRRGGREAQRVARRPAVQDAVGVAGVEDVAGAGRVTHGDAKCRLVEEVTFLESERAAGAHGGDAHSRA